MDASPAVQDADINGLVNAFIGQASTLTHRDSLHYDITGMLTPFFCNNKNSQNVTLYFDMHSVDLLLLR